MVHLSRTLSRTLSVKRFLPVVAVSVLLLTGCGVQGLQWHPGIAATIGSTTITDRRIDQLAHSYCTTSTRQSPSAGGPLRTQLVALFVTRDAAEQLAGQYDVTAGDTYNQAVSQARAGVVTVPESARDDLVELSSTGAYIQSIVDQVGTIITDRKGQSDATSDQKSTAGLTALSDWINDHDVDISPAYDVSINADGQLAFTDDDVSYAASKTAKTAFSQVGASAANPDYVATLSANQVCG